MCGFCPVSFLEFLRVLGTRPVVEGDDSHTIESSYVPGELVLGSCAIYWVC